MTKDRRFYISVEVDFFDHSKTLEVGEKLAFRHLKAIAWCHKNKTDGMVSKAAAKELLYSVKATDVLEAAGLWERRPNGWHIHDYLDHQRSRAQMDAASETGRNVASARWNDASTHAERIAEGNAESTAERSHSKSKSKSKNQNEEILSLLGACPSWPLDAPKDDALIAALASEYPALDPARVVRDLVTWALDNPLGKNPRMRLRTFFRKAEEWRRERPSPTVLRGSMDDQLRAIDDAAKRPA